MIFELNIGLDYTGCDKDPLARQWRVEATNAALREQFGYGNYASLVIGRLEGEDEPCLWARVKVNRFAIAPKLYAMAERLAQDCIAVLPENGGGVLVGPRAKAWGEFNPAYFRQPDAAGLASIGLDANMKLALS